MWSAIIITILAASGNNIGKALQKQATRTLPRLSLRQEIILQYLRNHLWLTGLITDLAGALLMIVAFSQAPVSIVQPVSGVGLVVLMVFSHFYLKERLRFAEWVAAAVALLGILGLGTTSEPDHLDHSHVQAAQVMWYFGGMLLLLGLECWARQQWWSSSRAHSHHISHVQTESVLYGLEAGACFGLSAASTRTGFMLKDKHSVFWVPVGLIVSMFLTTSGFVLQTRGLKNGNTIVVCTMAAVSSMLSGVLAGLLALGEKLPSTHSMKLLRLFSWFCILFGVTFLASGGTGLMEVVRQLASVCRLPKWLSAWLRQVLPAPLVRLGRFLSEPDTLPVVGAHKLEKPHS